MQNKLHIYNSLTRKKELFEPINPPHVGLYVCGPTVYSEPHLGHIRMAVNYDVLYRYLMHLGYKVRYVRNITDVGHLEDELTGEGEDRISKKARIEQLEPMEVVQKYKNIFQHTLELLNVLAPSIEPQASGHIIEQQKMIKKIIENGYAYEVNGSVYFDIEKYNRKYKNYGKLSGRKIDDLLANTRELEGQEEKHFPLDFALWKKAGPNHLMKWPSLWSEGFPGWHLECSAMGTKYLGETFDIHGGGMDLLFPHHECEIAQAVAANGKEHVKYWIHNNMITIDGQKMARSLNNFITLKELFSGSHPKLEKAYSPMTIRFFVLRAHYRSTLDFSNESLQAAETGLKKLFSAVKTLSGLKAEGKSGDYVKNLKVRCYDAMNDDLNTPVLLAHIFDGVRVVNSVDEGHKTISREELDILKEIFNVFVKDILGLEEEIKSDEKLTDGLISLLLNIRNEARINRDFAASDKIREELLKLGIQIRDTKDGSDWEME